MDYGDPVEWLAAAMLISSVLAESLNRLSDRPLGQLLLDEVWTKLSLLAPESTICLNAVDRLRRSANGELTNRDSATEQEQRPACPKCGNVMLRHFGIKEPDFLECVLLKCGHKEPINTVKENLRK